MRLRVPQTGAALAAREGRREAKLHRVIGNFQGEKWLNKNLFGKAPPAMLQKVLQQGWGGLWVVWPGVSSPAEFQGVAGCHAGSICEG